MTNGGSISYGIRLKWPDDYFTLLSTVNFQNFNLQDWTRNDFIIETGKVYNFSIKETLARNSLDKPLYPTTGSNISLSLQITPPYSGRRDVSDQAPEQKFKWIEYHKWRFNAEWYTPIVGNFVFRASAKFGFLGHYNKHIGTAPFERFQVGGDGLSNFTFYGTDIISLRGYEAFTNTDGSVRSDPIFNKFTLELRYPLSLNPSSTVYALLFAEGGNSWDNFGDYNPFKLKRSVGIGIRAFLPMFGLLGVDYGIRFDDNLPGDLQEANGFFDYILKNGKFSIILGFEPE